MEFVEQNSICGAVSSRFGSFPELFLCRVSVHGTQSEQTVYRERKTERENTHFIPATDKQNTSITHYSCNHIHNHTVFMHTHAQLSKPADGMTR